MMAPSVALGDMAAREVLQSVVLTFQNIRFVFYSCLRLPGEGYSLFFDGQ